MSIEQYLSNMKKIQACILKYIDDESNSDESFSKIFKLIDELKFRTKKYEFRPLLHLIVSISNNHHRGPNFLDKIFRIIKYLANDIKKFFTNETIYDIFNNNKRILLFVIDEKILIVDKSIALRIYKREHNNVYHYDRYFAKEINPFIDERIDYDESDYEVKRRLGENDKEICKIIRDDNVDEFIPYFEKSTKNESLYSIYETSEFLGNHLNNCINYAIFFGSIQIIKYLIEKKSYLDPFNWTYAVHSNNTELIFILEENNVELEVRNFDYCIEEAILSHHNDIVNYLLSNYPQLATKYSKSITEAAFSSYNFAYIEKESINESNLRYLEEYNYLPLIVLLIKNGKIDINGKIYNIFN